MSSVLSTSGVYFAFLFAYKVRSIVMSHCYFFDKPYKHNIVCQQAVLPQTTYTEFAVFAMADIYGAISLNIMISPPILLEKSLGNILSM